MPIVPVVAEGLGQITAQRGPLWLKGRGHLQIFSSAVRVALPDSAEAAAEPRIAKRSVDGNGPVEITDGFRNLILSAQKKTLQRQRLRIARRKLQALLQRVQRLSHPAKAEL